jgi:hypothetical protein
MTAIVFAIQCVDARQPGNHASVWSDGKAAVALRRDLTSTC